MLVVSNLPTFSHQQKKTRFFSLFSCFGICLNEQEMKTLFLLFQQEELLNELKGRKEAIKDQKLIKREALTDGTIETLLDGKEDEMTLNETIFFIFYSL